MLPKLASGGEVKGGGHVVDGGGEDPAVIHGWTTMQRRVHALLPNNITRAWVHAVEASSARTGEQNAIAVSNTAAKDAVVFRGGHEVLAPANSSIGQAHGRDLQLAVHRVDHVVDDNRRRGDAVGFTVTTTNAARPLTLRSFGKRQMVDGVSRRGARLCPGGQVLSWWDRNRIGRARNAEVLIAEQLHAGARQTRFIVIEPLDCITTEQQSGQP